MKFANTYDALPENFYAEATPATFSKPELLAFNSKLGDTLGLDLKSTSDEDLARIFSAQKILKGSHPIAMVYAGHQFGHFVPRLGDGRALLLGEVLSPDGKRVDIQLKGSGPTMYSRNGDGFSALGPVIREYIVSEAMHHLGVPTTRALAAVATGDSVYREGAEPGGVFTRVASSHIRIGTFQYFASIGDMEGLKRLLDYAVQRHYPEIKSEAEEVGGDKSLAMLFLNKVIEAQVSLVAKWMSIGFIHGVMNTDNMSISGETIDYGPCAFMDYFKQEQVYSYIDQGGRYSYSNQRNIVEWNLARLAECLIPLMGTDQKKTIELLNEKLSGVTERFDSEWRTKFSLKFGLDTSEPEDEKLTKMWLDYLEDEHLDFTLGFRKLSTLLADETEQKQDFFKQTNTFKEFKGLWLQRLSKENSNDSSTIDRMNQINPLYIPRNHQVEKAIQGAVTGDLTVFLEMNKVLENPYDSQPEFKQYSVPPLPEEEIENTFCGT